MPSACTLHESSGHFTSSAINSLRPPPLNIVGPFSEHVVLALEVKHTADNAAVEWDGLVAVTLILEE